jgi:prefoldin subunit 5
MFEKQMNPQYEAHERLCKSIGDMAKENERLQERIERLEETLDRLNDRINNLETENNEMRADLLLYREDKWRE